MSVVTNIEIERLIGFRTLEKECGLEDYTLLFQIPSGEWACVADRQILQNIARAILKLTSDPEPKSS